MMSIISGLIGNATETSIVDVKKRLWQTAGTQ
jgi:hypothetical protein